MGRKERHTHHVASCTPPTGAWPATQACALTGNLTGDLLVCRPALNPLSHTSQGCLHMFRYLNTYHCVTVAHAIQYSNICTGL